tara:strand:+ start:64 stop:528 length:465 start_codon:yes stop_codon:yes gene_type:complete
MEEIPSDLKIPDSASPPFSTSAKSSLIVNEIVILDNSDDEKEKEKAQTSREIQEKLETIEEREIKNSSKVKSKNESGMVIELQKMETIDNENSNDKIKQVLYTPGMKKHKTGASSKNLKKHQSKSSRKSLMSRQDSSLKKSGSLHFEKMITSIG